MRKQVDLKRSIIFYLAVAAYVYINTQTKHKHAVITEIGWLFVSLCDETNIKKTRISLMSRTAHQH